MSKQATVKEIARLACVSIGTVDRVLHGREGVSAATRARVEAFVETLGYRPNVLARQLSLGKTWLFRVLLPRGDQDSGYWSLCRAGIEAAAHDLAAFAVRVDIVEFDRTDPVAYRELLSRVLATGCDGLLVAPVLPAEIGPALGRLPPGLPYAFFDAYIEGMVPVFSIGQDAFAAGWLAGRLFSLLVPGTAPLVAIDTHPEDGHIRRRIAGFESFFGAGAGAAPATTAAAGTAAGIASGCRRVLVRECPGFDRAPDRATWLEALFDEEPGIGGLLVASASGHLAGEWLEARGRKASCAVLSWDLVPKNARALGAGLLDCVISQRPFEQGRLGLERLYRAIAQGVPGGAVTIASEIFLKENLPQDAAGGEGR